MRELKFENTKPIDQLSAALYMLFSDSTEHRVRRVLIDHPAKRPTHIERRIYNGVYDSFNKRELISVTPEVVKELRSHHYVEGTPEIGFTDETELKLTEYGISAACRVMRSRHVCIVCPDGSVFAPERDTQIISFGRDPKADIRVPEMPGEFPFLYYENGWEMTLFPELKGQLVLRNVTINLDELSGRPIYSLYSLVQAWFTFGDSSFSIFPAMGD